MTIYDNQEWYDIPPTIETYYRDRYNCSCQNRNCNLEIDSNKHGTLPGYQSGKCRCDDCRDARRQYNNSRKDLTLPEDDERHGTLNAYYNWNCRCDDCKFARLQKTEDKKKDNLPDGDRRHGQVSSYVNFNCRCYPCKKSYNTWQREYRKRKTMASKWYEASADDDFGISKREQNEIAGRAMGEHIWDKLEDIFGPIGLQNKLHSVGELEKRFPNHPIQIEDEDDPYVSHKVGDWEGRYFNGPYIELHHKKYGPMEVINVGDHKIGQDEFRHDVEHFVKHDAQQYIDNEEYNGRISSIHKAVPYHVSPHEHFDSIKHKGLMPGSDESNKWPNGIEPLVYMSPTADDAELWGNEIGNARHRQDIELDHEMEKWQLDNPMDYPELDDKNTERHDAHFFDLWHVNTKGLPVEERNTDLGVKEIVSKDPISHDRIIHIKKFVSSMWYEAEKVMPSAENNPWEINPQDPQDIDKLDRSDKSPCKCPDDRCKLTVDDPKHGTGTGYGYHKCRCRDCRDYIALYERKRKGLDLNIPIIPNVDQQNVLNMIPIENLFNDPNDPRHGTTTGYNIGCQCDPCKNAGSEYFKQYKLDKLQEMQNDPDHEYHGTPTGYSNGCRCDSCKNAGNEYDKQYKLDKLEKMQNDPDHELHGTTTGYNIGCHCVPCKNAKSEYVKQYKLDKLEKMQNDPDHELHGTLAGYVAGCKCVPCKNAGLEYRKQYRKNKKQSSMWYLASPSGTCLNCAVPLTNRMDNYCGTCHGIMQQGESQAYMQVNPNHPEARPFQKPHDFSGNE